VFLVAHSRAWPFADDSNNRMKLGASNCSAVVIVVLDLHRSDIVPRAAILDYHLI
jgi:hypothetical protein